MTAPGVAIRLGIEGKAEVEDGFRQIGDSGDREAARLGRAFAQQSEVVEREQRRLQAASAKLAAIQPQTPVQMRIADVTGSGFGEWEGSARRSAAAMKELLEEEAALEKRAESLRQALDPLYAAQKRYDGEVANANELLARGKITQVEHAAQITASERALQRATRELDAHSNSLGFNRTQYMVASHAARGFFEQLVYGGSVYNAFAAQQAHIISILQNDDNGMAGGLAKVTRLVNPLTIGIAALTAVSVAGAVAWLQYANAVDRFDQIAEGAGRIVGMTGDQMEASAEAAARAGNISIGAARDMAAEYVRTGEIGGDVLTGLIALTNDYAAATGVDAKEATKELGAAFADPVKGAQDLADKYGVVSDATVEYIAKLVEQNDKTEAQIALLKALGDNFDNAADHANILARGWRNISNAAADAWSWMGKAIDRALTGGSLMDRIQDLRATRARAMAGDGTTWVPGGAEDRELQGLEYQLRQQQARDRLNQQNRSRSRAQEIVDRYTGADRLTEYRKIAGDLRAGLATDMPPDQRREMTQTLQAYTHAIDTFIPSQEKAQRISRLDVQIAGAKTKAEKDRLTAERERVRHAGEVITAEEAETLATDKGAAAAARFRGHTDRHGESLRRQAEAMVVNTRETLKLAAAYLDTGTIALVAEARRKAMTDATRKGIDVEAQMRRELALEVAQQIEQGAKGVAHLREENNVRSDVNDQVAAGTLKVADMNRELQDQAILFPLLKLRAVAHGEALVQLTKVIEAYTTALGEAHAEEARSTYLTSMAASERRVGDIEADAPLAGRPRDLAVDQARRAAEHEADDRHLDALQREAYVQQRVKEAGEAYDAARAARAKATILDQQDSLFLGQAEIDLLQRGDPLRASKLRLLEMELKMRRENNGLLTQEDEQILQNAAGQEILNRKISLMQANLDEARQIGDSFIDTLFNPDTSHWKDFIKEIEADLLRLTLINPVKNWLFGEQNPTLGGVFSAFGSIFGNVKAGGGGDGLLPGSGGEDDFLSSVIASIFGSSPGHASGTEYFGGGATWVAENGPELVRLPRGSRITPAAETRRLLAANDGGIGSLHIDASIHAEGADAEMLAQVVAEQRRLREEMPGIAVRAYAEAKDRRWVK